MQAGQVELHPLPIAECLDDRIALEFYAKRACRNRNRRPRLAGFGVLGHGWRHRLRVDSGQTNRQRAGRGTGQYRVGLAIDQAGLLTAKIHSGQRDQHFDFCRIRQDGHFIARGQRDLQGRIAS